MRRLLIYPILLFFTALPVTASWEIGADLRCLDSIFLGATRIDMEVAYRWDAVRVSIPLRFSSSRTHELMFAETGVDVSVYPFDDYGFFIGVSMIHIGAAWGLEAPKEHVIISSSVMAGWTFTFPWFYLEPRISVLDVFSQEEARLELLSEAVPQYSKIRLSLVAGVAIP